jgi:type IX secretion system PorP/SprF family membrane protein
LSQFYEAPLLRNPALAGIFTGDVRVQAVYRNQLQSIGYPYVTKALSGEYKFHVGAYDDFITVGFEGFFDQAGITRLNTIQFMPGLNYHKSLGGEINKYLSIGFMAGFVNRYFDQNKLTFDNQYVNGSFNSLAPSGENFSTLKRTFADYATGISFNSGFNGEGNYYLGIAVYHFTKPEETYLRESFRLNPKIQANAGLRMLLNDIIELKGEFNYLRQGVYSEFMAGGIATYYLTDMDEKESNMKNISVGAGLFMRMNDAFIPVVKGSYNNFEIGMSYDANISKLTVASKARGGFELSLCYKGFLSANSSTINMVRCPRF